MDCAAAGERGPVSTEAALRAAAWADYDYLDALAAARTWFQFKARKLPEGLAKTSGMPLNARAARGQRVISVSDLHTYIDNVVDANLLASQSKDAAGKVFNVGQHHAVTLLDVVDLLKGMIGPELRWSHLEARSGDVKHSLGYRPKVTFEEGLRRTVEYFRQAGKKSSTGDQRQAL